MFKIQHDTFKCPYCYDVHRISDCKLVCKKSHCVNSYQEDDGTIKQDNRDYCLHKCKEAAVQVFCPNDEIMGLYNNYIQKYQINKDVSLQLDIPSEFRDGSKPLTVAVLGGVSSGKTSYITVLLNEIDNKLRNAFGCSFRILNTATQEFYRNRYYNFVYMGNEANEKTLANDNIPPLLYSLEFPNNLIHKRINLAFYDVAGEDLRGTDKMLVDKGYIANADLVIVLLDPLQMPAVRKKIHNKQALPDITESPTALIDRLVYIYRSVKKIRGKINIPLAVSFSKMDILKENGFFSNDDCAMFHESEHIKNKAFTQSDFINTQNTMQAIFENYVDGNPIPTLKMNFKNYAMFGFSALGTSPAGGSVLEEEIHPYRVLDPLIWALYEHGYIKKKNEEKI